MIVPFPNARPASAEADEAAARQRAPPACFCAGCGAGADGSAASPRAVLDTQVVLDWLVFDDPAGAAVGRAVLHGELRWVATQAMHAELMHVLGRGVGAARRPDLAAVSRRFLRWSETHPPAPPAAPALRCRDPDDRMFVDLALAAGARWLFSRDRAVLTLSRAALQHGVTVLRPADWTPARAAAAR